MDYLTINSLSDLNSLRTAPELTSEQTKNLIDELQIKIINSEWFTVGIMAESTEEAISVLRKIEKLFKWPEMKLIDCPEEDGPVFLKANQKSGEIRIRIEYGLGKGVLISGHDSQLEVPSNNWGPLPLGAFNL